MSSDKLLLKPTRENKKPIPQQMEAAHASAWASASLPKAKRLGAFVVQSLPSAEVQFKTARSALWKLQLEKKVIFVSVDFCLFFLHPVHEARFGSKGVLRSSLQHRLLPYICHRMWLQG